MAAHRYWAVLMLPRAAGGNALSLAEMEMRATIGGADQCSGGTALGAFSGAYPASNAFDNDLGTHWLQLQGAGGARLGYEFATPVTVAQMRLVLAGAGAAHPGGTYGPTAVWVQWSDDGTAWQYGSGAVDASALGSGDELLMTVSDAAPGARVASGGVRLSLLGGGAPGVTLTGRVLRWDAEDGGPMVVSGYTKIDGTPPTAVSRRVRVHDRRSGRLVREVWSDATGWFEVRGLRAGEYDVFADDHTLVYDPPGLSAVDVV